MGGRGSGRRPGVGRAPVDAFPSITVSELYRHGRPLGRPPILFTTGTDPKVEVAIVARKDRVECRCFLPDRKPPHRNHDFIVAVSWKPMTNLPNGSGVRAVMHCCRCDSHRRKLFFYEMALICRGCAPAPAYPSQRETQLERAQRVRLELGGSPSLLDPFPPRPPGVKEERYARIRDKARAREHSIILRAVADAARRLDRIDAQLARIERTPGVRRTTR